MAGKPRSTLFVFSSLWLCALQGVYSAGLSYGTPFQASVRLKVYERGIQGAGDRLLGFTPNKDRVRVPKSGQWYVRPMGSYKEREWRLLFEESAKSGVPGLDLSQRWDVTDETIEKLNPNTPLRFLRLDSTRVTDKGLLQVAGLKTLQMLTVSPKTTDVGLRALSGLAQLRELDLKGSKVTEASLADLTQFKKLETLTLNAAFTDRGAETLSTIKSLKELDASSSQMGDDATAYLSRMSNLEELYLSPRVTDDSLRRLSSLSHLKRLDISRARVTDAGIMSMENLQKLEQLALTDTGITDASMPTVGRLKALKTLELSGTQVTTSGLEFLASLSKLETLSLSWSELTSADLATLARCPAMKTIILDGTPLPETLMARLIEMRRQATDTHMVIAPPTFQQPAKPTMPSSLRIAVANPQPERLVSKKATRNLSGSGLRKLRELETRTSELADVYVPVSADPVREDENAPENYIGDIDVRISPQARRR